LRDSVQGAGARTIHRYLPRVPKANLTRPAERFGLNHDGYRGETIEVDAVLAGVRASAARHGWEEETFFRNPEVELIALRRTASNARRRLYVSAGIHGDEPAGPLAVRRLLEENRWPADADLWLCPCLNPAGFRRNTRENEDGLDLNRQYLHRESAAIAAHIQWLDRQPPFDLTVCVHEDWESHGFYVYELNPGGQPSRAPAIIEAVKAVCPIDLSPEIEGRAAEGGIIRPSVDPRSRPQWPEAFHLLTHKTRLSYTLEAPSDFPLEVRLNALVTAVRAATG
jgi:hypothetical protein